MYTSPVDSACNIGNPDISFVENKVPVNESSTENKVPTSPITLNAVEPLWLTTTPVPGSADADVEPDAIKVGVSPPPAFSNVVTLVENEADAIPNEPDIPVAVNDDPPDPNPLAAADDDTAVSKFEPFRLNDPVIFTLPDTVRNPFSI